MIRPIKNTFGVLALVLVLAFAESASAVSIRAGVGQFIPADSMIKETYTINAYTADIRFYFTEPFFAGGGAMLYNIHSAEIELSTPTRDGDDVIVATIKHRVDAFGAFAGVGAGTFLGKSKTGVYLYVCASGGFISPIVSQRVEYYLEEGDTTIMGMDLQDNRRWAFMANPHAGVEFRFLGFGAFAQVDYLWGNPVKYDPVEVEGVEIFPGGELTPSGWAIFVGVMIE